MLATGYNGAEFGSNGIMRNGNYVHWGAVAVDPSVIPLGTRMYISGFGNQVFVAEDTGSAIIGNRIDIWMPSVGQALEFAAQRRTVTIIR
jgi:3D (Asp-Asp-Asp) domain-containing protein